MITLTDRKLASLYASFEALQRTDPLIKLGDDHALQILAEIGDRTGSVSSKVLTKLKEPGLSRDAQIELVKKGMTESERVDLAAVIDGGTVPLEANAKQLLEAVLGRNLPVDGFVVTGDQSKGISGRTKPGATIEAINLTTAPSGRYHTDDTFVIGKADASGNFSDAQLQGDMAIQEGDVIRMRARYEDGTTSDWVNIKADTAQIIDVRNAQVALFRIGLAPTAGVSDSISVENINEGRQISEPGARVQFTNKRTGEKLVVTLDGEGTFPKGTTLKGKAGDTFSVAATDGANNADFSLAIGDVNVPGGTTGGDILPDPALHKDELNKDGSPKFGKKNYTGPLFLDRANPEDVRQGQLGDCYFPAAVAAMAKTNPELIENMIRANGDGTFSVTFKESDWASGQYKDVVIKVDGDLYTRSWGGPLYGHSSNSETTTDMELWFPLLEKAYAQWKGSYDAIGNGGFAGDVFEDFMGTRGRSISTSNSADAVWSAITEAVNGNKPIAAGTHDADGPVNYTNTGVYGDHAYSILGYETSGTERYVTLRNPWGQSEPTGNGANDGIFKLKLEEFQHLYDNVMYTH